MIYPWQSTLWHALDKTQLPHALLLYGAEGIGKTAFAQAIAHALLCESPQSDGHACGQCQACGWLTQHNHPDFTLVRPENLEEAPAITHTTDDAEAKASKTLSKEIRIEQIRQLIAFTYIGSHREKGKVAIIYPLHTLNLHGANALLKTLEEPPPATQFILLAHHLDQVLPTILSRTRRLHMPTPDNAQALAWLHTQSVPNTDATRLLNLTRGAPLAALALHQNSEWHEAHLALLTQLEQGAHLSWLTLTQRLYKYDLHQTLLTLQRWAHDLLNLRLTQSPHYYPEHTSALTKWAQATTPLKIIQFIQRLQQQQREASHPLSPKLVLESSLLAYCRLFDQP